MASYAEPPDRLPSPSPSQLPPVPASPTYSYASTANPLSQYNLPLPPPPRPAHAVLSKADLAQSQAAYGTLLTTAKAYRQALASLATASSAFGSALESCARLKESRAETLAPPTGAGAGAPSLMTTSFTSAAGACTADTLLATAGVHHLVANHTQILSETVYRAFEVPLLHDVDRWARELAAETESYEAAARDRGREIRRLEKEGLKLHRQRRRDVARFRTHLVELTGRLDGLTALHAAHARTLLRDSQDASVRVADAACSLVRAEVDIFEGLARKGWTGGGLEDVLERGEDLFAPAADDGAGAAGAADAGSRFFSILPPKSILADSASEILIRPGARHGRADSLLVEPDRYQSLTGAVSPAGDRGDADSIVSEPALRPRGGGPRPFSPMPIPVDPDEVMGERREPGSSRAGRLADDADDPEATPRPSGFKMLRRALDDEDDDDESHPWRDEGARSVERQSTPDSEKSADHGLSRQPSWGVTSE